MADETMPEFADRFPILKFFKYKHLPEPLQPAAQLFWQAAHQIVGFSHASTDYAEIAAGLRHLLEAKDCFVRANLGMIK
jgi:hypothetical protein